jgi:hypothetical protein
MADDEFEALPDTYPLSTHLVAGALAGIAEHCIMYPIDSIKVCGPVIDEFFGRIVLTIKTPVRLWRKLDPNASATDSACSFGRRYDRLCTVWAHKRAGGSASNRVSLRIYIALYAADYFHRRCLWSVARCELGHRWSRVGAACVWKA